MKDTETNGSHNANAAVKGQYILPLLQNSTGRVMIQAVSGSSDFLYNSYMVTSSGGEIVVLDPMRMPSKEMLNINPAAIISTHNHFDHVDAEFTESYGESRNILYTVGEIRTRDFHVYTILSSHKGDKVVKDWENYFAVLEVDGLRIVHMGDIGQTSITEEQLERLGNIDIAFMQFENSYSDMTLENEKGFRLIEQVNPKVVIPTHHTEASIPKLEKRYGKITEVNNLLTISKDELPKNNLKVYRILNYHKYN